MSELLTQIRDLNANDDHAAALQLLDSHPELTTNPLYCFHYGFALYESHREHESLKWFKKASDLGLEEINEFPNTYYPKSITEWLNRAARKAPQRIEKTSYEATRKANRASTNTEIDYNTFNFQDFWSSDDYSKETAVGKPITDTDISQAEAKLGYRLPSSYKNLIKRQNGGLLTRNHIQNPLQRDWTPESFAISGIYGIDESKPYSLCGKTGSEYMINEWGYPHIGIAIASDYYGHGMVFLDYTDCGPEGEPHVTHINQESNYEKTYLADNFAQFIQSLLPADDFLEEDNE